jgi:hypothetical protein
MYYRIFWAAIYCMVQSVARTGEMYPRIGEMLNYRIHSFTCFKLFSTVLYMRQSRGRQDPQMPDSLNFCMSGAKDDAAPPKQ